MEKRPIRSTLRQRQAEATAQLILEAAKALFLERGYAGTTIDAIAERAEVAVSTVYAVYGSKRGLLRALRAPWHARSHVRDVTYGQAGGLDPHQRLEALAAATCRQWETGAELLAIYTSAADADPEAALELSQALEGRRVGMETFALSLRPHLRPGLDVPTAAAILQALTLPEVFHQLVRRSAWTPEAYQSWLYQALQRELLE